MNGKCPRYTRTYKGVGKVPKNNTNYLRDITNNENDKIKAKTSSFNSITTLEWKGTRYIITYKGGYGK